MPQVPSPLVQALVALAQEPEQLREDLAVVLAAAPSALGPLAVDHGVGGVAHAHARHLRNRFPDLFSHLDGARRAAWAKHRTTLADLQEIAPVLDGIGAPWAVVKGPVLAELAYRRPDVRSYQDLDIVVHPGAFGRALRALEEGGADLLDRNWELIRSSRRAELSLRFKERTIIDLHWHLINEAGVRDKTSWKMGAVLARARVADLGPTQVPVLEPVDALVHIAVHACWSGGHRLLWLKDIERQSAAFAVPGHLVEARAREAGLWPPVNLALLRSARTFELVPPKHLALWSRVNRGLGCDRFRLARGFAGSGRTLANAARGTVVQSGAALSAVVLRDQLLPWGRSRGLGAWLPPAPPTLADLRRPGGSADDRASYLAMVAAQ